MFIFNFRLDVITNVLVLGIYNYVSNKYYFSPPLHLLLYSIIIYFICNNKIICFCIHEWMIRCTKHGIQSSCVDAPRRPRTGKKAKGNNDQVAEPENHSPNSTNNNINTINNIHINTTPTTTTTSLSSPSPVTPSLENLVEPDKDPIINQAFAPLRQQLYDQMVHQHQNAHHFQQLHQLLSQQHQNLQQQHQLQQQQHNNNNNNQQHNLQPHMFTNSDQVIISLLIFFFVFVLTCCLATTFGASFSYSVFSFIIRK